jgi:hypothetical protein
MQPFGRRRVISGGRTWISSATIVVDCLTDPRWLRKIPTTYEGFNIDEGPGTRTLFATCKGRVVGATVTYNY